MADNSNITALEILQPASEYALTANTLAALIERHRTAFSRFNDHCVTLAEQSGVDPAEERINRKLARKHRSARIPAIPAAHSCGSSGEGCVPPYVRRHDRRGQRKRASISHLARRRDGGGTAPFLKSVLTNTKSHHADCLERTAPAAVSHRAAACTCSLSITDFAHSRLVTSPKESNLIW